MTPAVTTLTGSGFTVEPPRGWEARIFRRPTPETADTAANRSARAGATGWLGEQTLPVVHLANFPLPAVRGDYGSGAVERMQSNHCFVALLEFGPDCLGSALYPPQGRPVVEPSRFDPNGLQRRLPGQSGAQYFFTENDRPMCLYVVLGTQTGVAPMALQVNAVLDRVSIGDR